MSFISKEVPTGTIDGVNKIFTLSNTPQYIDDIFFDGAIYTTFSLVWKVITLADAPTIALLVDYESTEDEIVVDSIVTFWDIKNKVWNLLVQKSTSTNFSDTIVWDEINHITRAILKWRIKNLLNPNITFRAGKLWFTEAKANVRILSGSTLTTQLDVWETEALMDTTYVKSSWYVEIWGDIISYTGKTITQLEWVLWQTVSHLVAEKADQLYEMPTAMDKPSKVFVIRDWNRIELPFDDTN